MNSITEKRAIEISDLLPTKRVKVNHVKAYIDAELSGCSDKILIDLDVTVKPWTIADEELTAQHPKWAVIAGSSGRTYFSKNRLEMTQYVETGDYKRINVPKSAGRKNHKEHVNRIVWEAFNGDIPTNHVIDHINDDRQDNRLVNLQLLTRSENCKKASKRIGFIPVSHRPPISITATNLSTGEEKTFRSMGKAAKALECCQRSIGAVICGSQKKVLSKDGCCYTFRKAETELYNFKIAISPGCLGLI